MGKEKPSMMEEFVLRVTTYVDDDLPDLTEAWGHLDAVLARPSMSRLTRFVIEQDGAGASTLSRNTFAKLSKKGVAVIWV